jgi:PAT family beta-lactamase induction signal transducer AmpG
MATQESQNEKRSTSPRTWVFSTYFAEGLPYTLVLIISSVFFTDIGVKERFIGYLNLLGIPWNLKFLWAPCLDAWSTKRTWQIYLQLAICLGFALMALLCWFAAQQGAATYYLAAIALLFVVLGFISATNDIAIDAYYLAGLTDKKEQAAFTAEAS